MRFLIAASAVYQLTTCPLPARKMLSKRATSSDERTSGSGTLWTGTTTSMATLACVPDKASF